VVVDVHVPRVPELGDRAGCIASGAGAGLGGPGGGAARAGGGAAPPARAAAGEVEGFALLVDAEGEAISGSTWGGPMVVASVDPETRDHWEEVSTIDLRDGRWPEADDEVVVDAATERRLDEEVGDRVRLQTEAGLQ
jgi:hypothetical protein